MDKIEAHFQHPGDFDSLVDAQNELVASMLEVGSWNRDTVDKMDKIKQSFLARFKPISRWREAFNVGPDVWWQSMAGEAISMRLWDRTAPLVSGLEDKVYRAVQDSKADKAGIDFVDIVELEGKKILVCTQTKTSGKLPLGQIEIVDLKQVSTVDARTLDNFRINDERKQRAAVATAEIIHRQLKQELGDKAPDEVTVLMIGLGVRSAAEDFAGWKQLMIEVDQGRDMSVVFADKLYDVLSGERSQPPQENDKWYQDLFRDKPAGQKPSYQELAERYRGIG
jgi:hypothetical protein